MSASLTRTLNNAKTGFLRLTRPQAVRTNQDTGLIRLIALITMAIDHFGKMCFPQLVVMREIGRLAFPLFAYGIAVGAVTTKKPMRYLSRVVLLALISQPLYAIGLAHETPRMYSIPFFENPIGSAIRFYLASWQTPSILLALSLGLAILLCLRERHWVLAVALYVMCECMAGKLDYGINGIRLMMIFYLLCEHPVACLIASTSFMVWWAFGSGNYTLFGFIYFNMRILSLPSIIFCCIPMPRRIRLPRWLTYGFYPAHLAVLAVITKCLI